MKKKLLLADDSVTIQKVVQITFSHDDYELTVVDNGDIAYEKARSQRPDLILADVFMPGKNGYELCAAVKNDPLLATVPVLLLTGTFEPFDEAKAKSVGADRWIAKPFESQALIACVEELLKFAAQAPVMAPPLLAPTSLTSAPPFIDAGGVAPADLSEDIWESDFPAESTFGGSDHSGDDAFAPTVQDDLWDVSGFESEGQAATNAAEAGDDLWGGDFATTDTPATAEAPPSLPVAKEDAVDPWAADDFSTSFAEEPTVPDTFAGVAEIPVADEVEILEELDLLEPFADTQPGIALADPFAVDDFSFDEEVAQPVEVEAPGVEVAPGLVPPAASPPPLPVVETPPQGAEVSSPAGMTTSTGILSDAQLELIVEKVAEVVISRLAGTLLEKIAWEVVPDLAETMIKEELRKIRESVAAD